MFVFGSGVLIGTQLNVANPTPINFGLIQKVSVDTSVSVKELYGQYAFPVAVGSGTRKVTCKASLARFSAQALGRLCTTRFRLLGSTVVAFAEAHPIPGTGPFTITVGNNGQLQGRPGRYLCIKRKSACLRRIVPSHRPVHGQQYHWRLHILYRRRGCDRPDHLFLHRDKSPVDELSEPRDRQPSGRSDVDLQRRRCSRPTRRRTRSFL